MLCNAKSDIAMSGCIIAAILCATVTQAHEAHLLIGRTADGQLTYHTGDGVQDGAMTVLALIPPGGLIEGYSASIPGFGMVLAADEEADCYPLEDGADIYAEFLIVDQPLLIIETPSYLIINEQNPPELHIGGETTAHVHPLWLLDTEDPAFDPLQCTWEASFILKDKGHTAYAASEVYTFRFAAGELPCPADFDCDHDVDADDFELFANCMSGPAISDELEDLPLGCVLSPNHQDVIAADLDQDAAIDLADFAQFQDCCQGVGVACDPACSSESS